MTTDSGANVAADGPLEARRTRAHALLATVTRTGEPTAADELLALLYDELRELARARLARQPAGATLQPTALVHEAWMRLADGAPHGWDGRRHFFGAAANAMRNVLVDRARARGARKRGGDRRRLDLDRVDEAVLAAAGGGAAEDAGDDLLELDAALARLAAEHPRPAEVVTLRFFAGLDHPRIAELLEVSVPTVERDWRLARAWLGRALAEGDDSTADRPRPGDAAP